MVPPTSSTTKKRVVRFATNEDGDILATPIKTKRRRRRRDGSKSSKGSACSSKKNVFKSWCQEKEFIEMRKDAFQVLDQVREGSCDAAWEKKRRYTYRSCLERVFRCCLRAKSLTSGLRQDLGFWMSVGHSRRGLERFILDETLGKMRDEQRMRVLDGVLFVQDKCREEKLTQAQTERLLQTASEVNSKPARIFAQHMARADRVAVIAELQLQLEQKAAQSPSSSSSTSSSPSFCKKLSLNSRRSSDTDCTASTAYLEDDDLSSNFSNPAA